jgi:hypothetical protein
MNDGPVRRVDGGRTTDGLRVGAEIQEAERQLGLAEEELTGLVHALDALSRAEKTISSAQVERALSRVTLARTQLEELQRIFPPEDDGEG